MTETSNQISDGVFFSAVVMGRDVQVMLPAEIRPALTGLPRPAAVFTGRDQQVAELLEELRPDRPSGTVLISAVAGMGGIGKTELVLHTAHIALRDRGWFPGGVLFVDMFGYDTERRLSAGDALLGWLQAIGIPGEHIPATEQDRSRLWRSVLDAYTRDDRRLLLIIDNAADEAQVNPLLPSDDRIPVLVTSRHTLDLDARLHDLDTLDGEAAESLIRDVVAQRRPHDPRSNADMSELVEVCTGLPLALHIVAALMADRPQLQADALAAQLRSSRIDGLSRQQVAVRAAFDLSYRALTEAQARLFRLMPVNPGPELATATAAALADVPKHEVAPLLADLHRAHLVEEPVADRWRMHDLIRRYAAEQPSPPDETAAGRRRLFAYYAGAAAAAAVTIDRAEADHRGRFSGREQALAWFDAEHTNLVNACTAEKTQELAPFVGRLALSLWAFFQVRRHFTDWITVAGAARGLLHEVGDRQNEGTASDHLGLALQAMRRFDDAAAAHQRARDLLHEVGDRLGESQARGNLATALQELGRVDEAASIYREALVAFREIDDRRGEARSLNNLGLLLQDDDQLEEALEMHLRAGSIFHDISDHISEAQVISNIGIVLRHLGRVDDAVEAYSHAQDIFDRVGDRYGEATAANNLGNALRQSDRHDEAIKAFTHASVTYREIGDRHGEGTALDNMGLALADLGRSEEAQECWERAVVAFTEAGDAGRADMTRRRIGPTRPNDSQ